jgi:Mrp family chromosome partitioning ATPase
MQHIDLKLNRGALDVLPAGALPPDPGEFAVSYPVAEIFEQLRSTYDIVIVDTPPILWVGDALTLSSQADGLIVVTRLKGMKRATLRELRRVLDVVPTRTLGFVLTGQVPGERSTYRVYGLDYGYQQAYAGARHDRRTVAAETAAGPPGTGDDRGTGS